MIDFVNFINTLWFTRRDLISDGYDKALEYISRIVPLKIHQVATGTKCWTWRIPEKWSVGEVYIEDSNGRRILDVKSHPLHVVSYSLPVDKTVKKEELLKHLYTNQQRPDEIPFEFKYYEQDWGFCIQHNRLKDLTDETYKVFIDSKFEKGTLKIGEYTIPGKIAERIIFVAHLCHPAMANDNLAGVAVLLEVAKEMERLKPHYSYTFLVVPETIGSIAYLSQNENLIPMLKYGIFLEMLGNDNEFALQLTRQGKTQLDRIARYVLKRRGNQFKELPFLGAIGNDEMVFNGPGVNIPMISLSRFPYPEYHTSEDNPGIIQQENLAESVRVIMEIIEILETDYMPQRTFKGPVFLSGYGLWVDWKVNKALNKVMEQIMFRLEGDMSVFDIAEELAIEFKDVLAYVDKFYDKGLIIKKSPA